MRWSAARSTAAAIWTVSHGTPPHERHPIVREWRFDERWHHVVYTSILSCHDIILFGKDRL
jgi:hypothetical protein